MNEATLSEASPCAGVMRIQDAIAAAERDDVTYYAFPVMEGMSANDLLVVLVHRIPSASWCLTVLEGRYDGDLQVVRTGRPSAKSLRDMANVIFHKSGREIPSFPASSVEMVRRLEDYDDDVVLHPRAARTVVEARRAEDSRTPIVRPSPFCNLLRNAMIGGSVLVAANMLAVMAVMVTGGHASASLRHFVLTTTLVTLGVLALAPFLLSRLKREYRLFRRSEARSRGRSATIRVAQMAIFLALVTTANGLFVLA